MKVKKIIYFIFLTVIGLLIGFHSFKIFVSFKIDNLEKDLKSQNKEWKGIRALTPYNANTNPLDSMHNVFEFNYRLKQSIDECLQNNEGYYIYKVFGVDWVEWNVFSLYYYDSNKGLYKSGYIYPCYVFSKTPISEIEDLKFILFKSLDLYCFEHFKGFKTLDRKQKLGEKEPTYNLNSSIFEFKNTKSRLVTLNYVKIDDKYIQYRDYPSFNTVIGINKKANIRILLIFIILSLVILYAINFLITRNYKNIKDSCFYITKYNIILLIIMLLLLVFCIPYINDYYDEKDYKHELLNSGFDNYVNENYPLLKYTSLGLSNFKEIELNYFRSYYDSYDTYSSLNKIKMMINNNRWIHNNARGIEQLADFVSRERFHIPKPADIDRKYIYKDYFDICTIVCELNNIHATLVDNDYEAQEFISKCDSLCNSLRSKLFGFEYSHPNILRLNTKELEIWKDYFVEINHYFK